MGGGRQLAAPLEYAAADEGDVGGHLVRGRDRGGGRGGGGCSGGGKGRGRVEVLEFGFGLATWHAPGMSPSRLSRAYQPCSTGSARCSTIRRSA